MSRVGDKKSIWVVSPMVIDDGEKKIDGYTRLRKLTLACVPETRRISSIDYGRRLTGNYNFNDNKPIDIAENGGDGIYFEEPQEPTEDDKGMYKNPPYISTPVTHFGKQWQFTAEKVVNNNSRANGNRY